MQILVHESLNWWPVARVVPGQLARRLTELGITLPPPSVAVGVYSPALVDGRLIWVSGQIATEGGVVMNPGRVDADVDVPTAKLVARRAVLQALATAGAVVGGLDRIERVIRVGVFVASSNGFVRQHEVANGATEVLVDLLGDAGRPVRTSVGVAALPLNAPVEIDLLARAG